MGSLGAFDLVFELEKEFDIEIPAADALGLVIVQEVIASIRKRTRSK